MRSAWQRTHSCGELRLEHVGQTVTLNGWVNTDRDHGGLVFIDLRDRYGITQIVFHPEQGSKIHEEARTLRSEFVISVTGKVEARPPAMRNPKRKTGDIELLVTDLTILNKSETPPFELTEGTELASEELRLKYRYLDLRRQKMQDIIVMRHELCRTIREMLSAEGFLEVETPLLGRSTPEGARDYLVPSRVHDGLWYALPQSPQLYKQILMIAGYDKYFQIARCLRDEDLRANRQPEFTQLDLEMTFVEIDDVMNVIERLTQKVFERCINYKVELPFQRIPYAESMLKYGNDKPDLRFGLEITDVTDVPVMASIKVLEGAINSGGRVRGINAKGKAEQYSNAKLNGPEFQDVVKNLGAKGLLYMKVEADGLKSSVMKFLSPEQQKELEAALRERMDAQVGDLLFFVADSEDVVCSALAGFRLHLGKIFGLIDKSKYAFAWVVDFPMFMWDKEENRWAANHHPFTAPKTEHLASLQSDPGKAEAKAYDLVINGDECGGGSIRIHSPEVQSQVFGLLGMSEEEAKGRFGFLLDALKFGAPPHGGIALGIDRWTMMLAETDNIRDCIAFPKTQRATDLMTGAPGAVDKRQLKELGLVK